MGKEVAGAVEKHGVGVKSVEHLVLVLDSGGSTCKLGISGNFDSIVSFPNAVGKLSGKKLLGQEIQDVQDVSSLQLKRPVDRGYVVNWDLQKEIWGHGFKNLLKEHESVRGKISGIVVSEPYMNLPSMRQEMKRMLREDMKFASVLTLYPATMAMYFLTLGPGAAARRCMGTNRSLAMEAGAGVIIDIGFSYTHVVPFFDYHPIKNAIKRVDLGGKALTNYMKELVSFRSMNMMKETNLMEHIREKLCFVSEDVERDLEAAASKRDSPFKVEWFLPDGVTSKWGHIRDPSLPRGPKDPILVVNNERFMVPELLFNPGDIGMDEAGLAEATWQAVLGCHPNIQGLLCANVSVIGGLAKCKGLVERLQNELRPLVPDDYDLNIDVPQDPQTIAWRGAALIGSRADLYSHLLAGEVDG